MFLQRLSKAVTRKWSVALALLTMLGAMQQPLAWSAARTASASAIRPTSAALLEQAGQDEQSQNTALSMADALFNGVVRQAFESQAWQVGTLNNTLDWSAIQISNGSVRGAGDWQIDATDETEASAHFEGKLSFDLQSDAQTSNGFTDVSTLDAPVGSTHVFTGTFSSDQSALDFTALLSSSGGGTSLATEARYDVSLTRNGTTSRAISTSSGTVEKPAYGFTRSVTGGTLDRDGKTSDWTNTTTTRTFGEGETELWQEMASTGGDAGSVRMTQHSSQRIVGDNISQYVDQLDLTRDGKNYRLEKPGSVTGTMGGAFTSDLVLVDEDGNKTELNKPGGGRLPGLASPLHQAFGDTVPLSPDEAALLLGLMVGGMIIMSGGAAGILLLGGSLSGLSGSLIIGGGIFAAAMGSAGIIRSTNGDPYFVLADLQPNSDPIGPTGVQITRVTGGLIASPPAPTSTDAGVTGISLTSAEAESTNGQPYDDDPVPFVGGALPAGSQGIGEWIWDQARQYNVMQSHTQPASAGPQMHYFIHATSPMKPVTDTNIVQYVYLDPANVPTELYLQFYAGKGDGEHRAYWGENRVQTGGAEGTASLFPMGSLPPAGRWVRLSIPASNLGLVDSEVNGVLYGLYNGKAWWGPTTTSNRLLDSASSVEPVAAPMSVITTTPGAQISYRIASPMQMSIEILDADGKTVRKLQDGKDETTAGSHITTWDAKNDSGALVPDAPYTARFTSGGKVVAEKPITITPLVANIVTPGSYSLVRGDQVPVIAEAYGDRFSSYTLDYGAGISPTTWYTLTDSGSPTVLPAGHELKQFNPGNLANWNVGINEFKPWDEEGLAGVYTLRLRVTGVEGQQASDTKTVIVGRLAHTAEGGTIASSDGKARLIVPELATTDPFALMAIVPAQDLDPGKDIRASLPANADLAGDVYELLPAGERFRRPATLELPYTGDSARTGIMLGDGTPGGWRYLGGEYDAQKGVVSVPILEFGGSRTLAGVFTSDNFGPVPANQTESTNIHIPPAKQAPLIASAVPPSGTNSLFAFYSDMESSPGEWASLDISGTQLSRVTGADAGVSEDNSALKVTRLQGGARLLRVRSTPYNASQYPIISFDYRLPDDYVPDLYVKSGGTWWQLSLGANVPVDTAYFKNMDAPKLENDGEWHHYSVDIAALLQKAEAQTSPIQVDEIVLGQFEKHAYMQVEAVDSGATDSAYYIDNFAALAPTSAGSLHITWAAPSGVSFNGYSAALNSDITFSPEGNDLGAATSSDVTLPSDLQDGLYYYHLAGKRADGSWSTSTDLPILLDRTAPAIGSATILADAGVASFIQIPASDTTGVAPDSLRVKLGDRTYSPGSGLTYDPLLGSINISPASLEPPLAPFKGGDQVEVTLVEASDRAGNKLSTPVAWSFTADTTQGDSEVTLRRLTVKGGSSPALTPDGQTLAFVSARNGSEKIWVMKSDDYEEKAATAKPLTGASGAGRESAPAWSPDGQLLAFVSNTSGVEQVWTANADGQDAKALTTGDGGAASPSWLADGSRIVFVRDGNIWSVKPDGSDLQPLTRYPERPIQSVSAQPVSGGQLLAVGFKLYQETIEIFDTASGELTPLTEGGRDREPAWLDGDTILFSAPSTTSGADQQEAIWQISAHGGKTEPFGDSPLPGIGDFQPSTVSGEASRQDQVAIVSNRSGSGNIWVRQDERVGRMAISPAAGAAPGEATVISFVLPTDATVTLDVLDKQGSIVRSLIAGESKQAGPQEANWDGLDNNGQEAVPGDYTAKLEVKQSAGGSVTRYAGVRRVETTGTLQLLVEQWTGQSAESDASLRVTVYPSGTRARPAASTEANNSPLFTLPAGRYDAVVEYRGARHEERGLLVEGGKDAQTSVDLGLGGLQPALLTGEGQPLSGLASVAISKAGDPNALPLQTRYTDFSTDLGFALPPGAYDLHVQYGSVSADVRDVRVSRGQITQPQINLNSGLVRLQVDARDGEPAETGGRLLVQAVDPKDHSKAVSSAVLVNPAELPLPAGTYDLMVDYGVAAPGQDGMVFGFTTQWVTGVKVQSGQTVEANMNLKLTPVTITLLDAPDKPAPAGAVSFRLSRVGEQGVYLATTLVDTARLELPEGEYSVIPDYKGAALAGSGPLSETITVKYGQPGEFKLKLGVGHIAVDVHDDQGNSQDATGLVALAYPAGQRDTPFATAFDTNPLDLPLRGGVDYDIVLRLADGKSLTLPAQKVAAGDLLTVDVALKDFK